MVQVQLEYLTPSRTKLFCQSVCGPGPDLIAILFRFDQSMNRPQAGLLNLT
jgi:hypothetical protein